MFIAVINTRGHIIDANFLLQSVFLSQLLGLVLDLLTKLKRQLVDICGSPTTITWPPSVAHPPILPANMDIKSNKAGGGGSFRMVEDTLSSVIATTGNRTVNIR